MCKIKDTIKFVEGGEMKVLVTGGAGFIGSHVAEFYANKGEEVVVLDNISCAELLGHKISNAMYNWNYLKRYKNIELIKGDIRDAEMMKEVAKDADLWNALFWQKI